MTRFPSLAAVFVDLNSAFELIEGVSGSGAPVYFKLQRTEMVPSAWMHGAGIGDTSLVKA